MLKTNWGVILNDYRKNNGQKIGIAKGSGQPLSTKDQVVFNSFLP